MLLMMFLGLRKLGNICCGHKMFFEQNQKHFLCPGQKICVRKMLRARANGETFAYATMCPRLPETMLVKVTIIIIENHSSLSKDKNNPVN